MRAALAPVIEWVERAPEQAIALVGVAWLLTLLLSGVALARCSRLARGQARLLKGLESGDLERMLGECLEENKVLWRQLDALQKADQARLAQIAGCIQQLGLVRYDAVANTGGQQSFSLALLDAQRNGLVISVLHTRTEMRLYTKAVVAGTSPQPLTDEEKQAISRARRFEEAGR